MNRHTFVVIFFIPVWKPWKADWKNCKKGTFTNMQPPTCSFTCSYILPSLLYSFSFLALGSMLGLKESMPLHVEISSCNWSRQGSHWANEPLQSSLMVLLFCIEKSRLYLTATVVVLCQCFDTVERLPASSWVRQCFDTVERLPASSCAASVFWHSWAIGQMIRNDVL